MTRSPDPGRKTAGNEPEPPVEQLYAMYLASLEHDRKKMMADAARVINGPHLEELIAKEFQPVAIGEFQQHLDDLDGRGVRHVFVNRLVRGPGYCERNPDDESIRMPLEERRRWVAGLREELIRAMRADEPARPGLGAGGRG